MYEAFLVLGCCLICLRNLRNPVRVIRLDDLTMLIGPT